ncbi:MAG: aminotransferase class I/II-fold pyridoxal phosphate-dependent enzyme, partial [Muribaculaceae bacterium]|nr:aminotransferase class I/II-fold pyridoxal phosphate-dependent enzyme [Muribaculaceae bacterium]
GIMLSKCSWQRFRHNDITHLERILDKERPDGHNTLIIIESIYSMDGDSAPVEDLISLKRRHPGVMIYIDEAHAVGACGPRGLGLVQEAGLGDKVDILLGTMGKALASTGAYAVLGSEDLRMYMINKARSLIFSTAMPPICAAWGQFIFERMQSMDAERAHLARMSELLYRAVGASGTPSHIAPLMAGSAARALALSEQLERMGYHALPIRTPTVPPGTERLRFSISASMTSEQMAALQQAIQSI